MSTHSPSRYDVPIGDDGCHLYPHCLECPRPLCIYDEPDHRNVEAAEARDERNAAICAASQYLTVNELTAQFGISRRTLSRILAPSRKSGAL